MRPSNDLVSLDTKRFCASLLQLRIRGGRFPAKYHATPAGRAAGAENMRVDRGDQHARRVSAGDRRTRPQPSISGGPISSSAADYRRPVRGADRSPRMPRSVSNDLPQAAPGPPDRGKAPPVDGPRQPRIHRIPQASRRRLSDPYGNQVDPRQSLRAHLQGNQSLARRSVLRCAACSRKTLSTSVGFNPCRI